MKVSVTFQKGDQVESCYLELRGPIGPFVALGWLADDDFDYDNSGEQNYYWRHFHYVTDGAFDDLGARTVHIPAHRIAYIRECDHAPD